MKTEHVEELLDLEAIGALDPEESASVRAHVTECAHCRTSLDEAQATAARLAVLAPMRRAPGAMRERVMAEVRRSEARTPSESTAVPVSWRVPTPIMRFNRRWGTLAAMLFIVPLAGLLTWNFLLQNEVNALKQDTRQMQETQRDVVLLALPSTVRARFSPTDHAGTAQGTVSWNPDERVCKVSVRGLPRQEPGVSYRVFYQGPRGVMDAGELGPDEEGAAEHTFDVSKWRGDEYHVWISAVRHGAGTEHGPVLLQASLRRN